MIGSGWWGPLLGIVRCKAGWPERKEYRINWSCINEDCHDKRRSIRDEKSTGDARVVYTRRHLGALSQDRSPHSGHPCRDEGFTDLWSRLAYFLT